MSLTACAQLKTAEHKKTFLALIKRVAKLEEIPAGSGQKYIVMRNPAP